jgi:hypothetical protein
VRKPPATWKPETLRALGCAVLAFLALQSTPALGAVAMGTRTIIWPWVFSEQGAGGKPLSADERMKSGIAVGNLDHYDELGATWNIVDVWQDVDGPDGFRRLDRVMEEHGRRRIQVALRLLERPEVYEEIRRGTGSSPANLSGYRSWIASIGARYGDRVRYYMISNEADHDIGYNLPVYRPVPHITLDEYGVLLKAAFETLQATDRRLQVADHGASSYSLTLAVMDDLALGGSPGEALAFWRAMQSRGPGEGERTLAGLVALLAAPESRRRIEFVRRGTAELAPYRTVFQLHHYYGAGTAPAVVQWVRDQLPDGHAGQPLVAAEVGYLVPSKRGLTWDGRPTNVADMSRYDERDHGQSIGRTFAALAGTGIVDMLYWDMRFHVPVATAASLFVPSTRPTEFSDTFPPRVFRFMSGELAAATAVAPGTGLRDQGFAEYRFGGPADFSVVWRPDRQAARLPPNVLERIERIADVAGRPAGAPDRVDWSGGDAIVVYWKH